MLPSQRVCLDFRRGASIYDASFGATDWSKST